MEERRDFTFDQYINFLLIHIRQEPEMWIKSSPKYQEVIAYLKEKFGESMGAGDKATIFHVTD